MYPDYRYPP
jgi:hypothetical protein